MGGLSSALGAVSTVGSVVSALGKSYGDYSNVTSSYKQAQDNYNENQKEIADKEALDAQQVKLANQQAALNRQNTLRRAVASQQAAFGGQGIDTSDGSAQAAIQGLFQNDAQAKAYQDSLDNLKLQSIGENADAQRRKNLLNLQHSYENSRDRAVSNVGGYGSDFGNIFNTPSEDGEL